MKAICLAYQHHFTSVKQGETLMRIRNPEPEPKPNPIRNVVWSVACVLRLLNQPELEPETELEPEPDALHRFIYL